MRTRAGQVGSLLDGRPTLAQRRRLLAAAGWLALLAATLHVDLGQRGAAGAARTVAGSLGREIGYDEIGAWAHEIDTWTALVDQDWPRAAVLAAAGEALAPSGSAVAVQLAAQSARPGARLGDGPEVRAALRRCAARLDRQPRDRPADHHFYFDGSKLELYTGTALARLGDPTAEEYARHVHFGVLALEFDELVPSNAWRADELTAAVNEYRGVPEVEALRELSAQRMPGAD